MPTSMETAITRLDYVRHRLYRAGANKDVRQRIYTAENTSMGQDVDNALYQMRCMIKVNAALVAALRECVAFIDALGTEYRDQPEKIAARQALALAEGK